ncbi:histidine phosphotransferase family protein [Palleronia caenipelagi]|uniref:Histidine phosphotransferase n=1 Tax=Palleronia caenipelagi TaxID=2489174 RepID=A0A547Q683_9RHOB|nr:histidine phosphotransferase family protein [Palleronia caenipelagi]TRD21874.1 histidine phosphotransferase [Palleronia caenipelagi]
MTNFSPELNWLIGSRICHDIANPLGAIGNGIELVQMTGAATGPEIDLVIGSHQAAVARLNLFRLAFGASAADQTVTGQQLADLRASLAQGRNVSLDWDSPGDLNRDDARLAALLLMTGETMLAYGGKMALSSQMGGFTLRLKADRLRAEAEIIDYLTNPAAPLPPASEVHLTLTRLAAEATGRTIRVTGDTAQSMAIHASR